jgi:hypothetical protein
MGYHLVYMLAMISCHAEKRFKGKTANLKYNCQSVKQEIITDYSGSIRAGTIIFVNLCYS